MAWKGNRYRPILKSVTFSEEEWRWIRDAMRVENRMRRSAGLRQVGWMAFARNRIRTAHAVNIIVPPDLRGLAAQVARIGNNINQIARQANMRDETTYGQIMEAQAQLRELRGLLATLHVEASRQVEPEGRPGWL